MIRELRKRTQVRMEGALNHFRRELAGVRTGRASLSMLEGIKVDYYGVPTPLNQVATLSVPESRLITIQPWETRMIPEIEKAIQTSDLGLTPHNDGKMIRIPVPPLDEERRRDLVRLVRKMAEEARVAIRNVRRDAIEELRRMEREGTLPEDDARKGQEEIQKLTDQFIRQVDETLRRKEAEIMEV